MNQNIVRTPMIKIYDLWDTLSLSEILSRIQ